MFFSLLNEFSGRKTSVFAGLMIVELDRYVFSFVVYCWEIFED